MKNKRLLMLVSSVCVILVLGVLPLMVACAKSEPAPESAPVKQILVGGAGVGGTYYPLACGLMTIFNKNVPGIRATAVASGGSYPNIRAVDSGEFTIALAPIPKAIEGYQGGSKELPDPMKINYVSLGHGSWTYFVTLDPEIKTLYDLEGKRIAIGAPGQYEAIQAKSILKGIGFQEDVDYTPVMQGQRDAIEALLDGRADAAYFSQGKRGGAVLELSTLKPTYFIKLPAEKMDAMTAALDEAGATRSVGTLPAGTFDGMSEDYQTFVGPACLIVNSEEDEELVYALVKALWENIETLGKVNPAGYEFDINDVKINIGPLPMHPGALRYYKEVGVLTEAPYKG